MKITLDNGRIVEGTAQEVSEYLLLLEKRETHTYESESRGTLIIEDMDTKHLKNAVLKKVKEGISELYEIDDVKELVELIREGILFEDDEFENMLNELEIR